MNVVALQRDQLLLDAVDQIAAARDTSRAVSLLRKTGRRAIRCDGLSLMLREAGEIRPVAEDSASSVAGCLLMRETGIASMAIEQRRRLVVSDVASSELVRPDLRDSSRVRSLAAIPVGGELPFGALVACWDRPGAVTGELVDTIEFLAAALGRTLQATRLIDVLPLLLFTARPDGSCEHLGRQWRDYSSRPGSEVEQGWKAATVHPADRPVLAGHWATALATQSAFEVDHRLLHRDAGYRWFRTRAVPVHDPLGRVLHWAGTCTEIDALVEARMAETVRCEQIERRLRDEIADRARSGARLAKTERIEAIGQLTSGVAHDFNNLLTVIIGNLEFLEAEATTEARPAGDPAAALPDDRRTRARLSAMRQAAERGGDLTRQLLAFARRQRLEPRPTDLNQTAVALRGLLPAAIDGLEVELAPEPDLWPALVDRAQIERMILNLALNARDAMPAGGAILLATRNRCIATLEADAIGLQGPGDFVEISVTDGGTGMVPQVLARAFEPFFTTKPAGTGSGLGLSQIWGFAQQSGGIVTIRSAQGEGTTVAILLPRAHAEAEPQQPAPHVGIAPVARPEPAPRAVVPVQPAPDRVVLLVDDDVAVREVTSTIVSEAGYRVLEAASGQEALERLQTLGPVDLMVTDYAMPGMNGFELACAARTCQSDLKVLFVTGYADLTAFGDLPESGILLKPFRAARLLDKISGALGT